MANITYNPQFTHEDWIDNEDVVQAGGEKGFNKKFHDLEAEFERLSKIIQEVNAAISALQAGPPPQELKATYTPTLFQTAAKGWSHGLGVAIKQSGETSARGMMAINLPHGVTLKSFRATGRNENPNEQPADGNLRIYLRRQPIEGGTIESISRLTGLKGTFDEQVAIDAQFALVDTTRFKYFITADLNNAEGSDDVTLFAFQITYDSAPST